MSLPQACSNCGPMGGYWVESERGGMKRCGCPRGLALVEMARIAALPPVARDPVMSSHEAEICVEMMASSMSFVPGIENSVGRGAITVEIREMCADFDQAVVFVRRFCRLYGKWPGTKEMRWAFCQMGFKPLDAIESAGWSEIYQDGLPEAAGGSPMAQIEPSYDKRSRELPPGEVGEILRGLVERKSI